MKHNVTQLEEKNELVNYMLENYLIELEPRNYQAKEASSTPDTQPDLLQFSRADEIGCNIVDLVLDIVFISNFLELDNGQAFFNLQSSLAPQLPSCQIYRGGQRTDQLVVQFSNFIFLCFFNFLIILYINKLVWLFIYLFILFLFVFSQILIDFNKRSKLLVAWRASELWIN